MHLSPSRPLFLLVDSLIVLFVFVQTFAKEGRPLLAFCSNEKFAFQSPYLSNLRLVLAGLVDSTPRSSSLYSINSVEFPASFEVFGLAQCRPDVSTSICASCLNHSSATATTGPSGCGYSKSALLRYEYCLIRYSEKRIFDTDGSTMLTHTYLTLNASKVFSREAQRLMTNEIMPAAADSRSRFSLGASNDSEGNRIYGMAWCLMDSEGSDCLQCLDEGLGSLPQGKLGGRAISVACVVQFGDDNFFSTSEQGDSSDSGEEGPTTGIIETTRTPEDSEPQGQKTDKSKKFTLVGTFAAAALFLLVTLFILLLRRRRQHKKLTPSEIGHRDSKMIVDVEALMFNFDTLRNATDNFSMKNKLGQGGFGPVYKGILESGQEIAVKRLSTTSDQGLSEMENEVNFIAKLQHKNLVKILGYCLEGDEKLLVYEYLPNGSLDKCLFDPVKRLHLNWNTRLRIIEEIGRGLLYLHEDSHFKVIHRDLKASNILLDGNMNPKISDFGLAKLFGVDETHKNTRRIAVDTWHQSMLCVGASPSNPMCLAMEY